MKIRGTWLLMLKVTLFAGLTAMLCLSCSNSKYEGKIVAVEQADDRLSGDGARLIVLDPEKPGNAGRELLGDFHSACAPSLSYDGRYLVFQGKEQAEEPWQIWVLDLNDGTPSRITHLEENCTSPLIMPDETVIFSRENSFKGTKVHDLWSCGIDGCCLTRITFNPSNNLYPSVLKEGRVLFYSNQQYPLVKDPVLMVMRPDGTKAEIYTPGGANMHPVSGGSESADGFIYFISGNGQLSRVLHRRPLHTFENLSGMLGGDFASVNASGEGTILVSYRPAGNETFDLYTFDPGSGTAPELLFSSDKHLSDPVQIQVMEQRPRILPSAVNPDTPTGLLMSQDINHSMLPVNQGISGDSVASLIRVSAPEGELATVEVKADGSFYLKLDADVPFRMETLNSRGETVRGPSDWIYLRPGERRACTGCHADPELAPENIQPLAVKEDPVVVVADMMESSN